MPNGQAFAGNNANYHMALPIRRARAIHPFLVTARVFLPDPAAAGYETFALQYPLAIPEVMKSIKDSSTTLINHGRAAWGELWQGRLFDRAQRLVKGRT